MSHRAKKRKTRPYERPEAGIERQEPDPSLFIQAHEADLVRGPQARQAARSLEVTREGEKLVIGNGLLQWTGGLRHSFQEDNVEEHVQLRSDDLHRVEEKPGAECGIWVDRYDARLLLEALPDVASEHSPTSIASGRPSSPGGWSDLPSDAEDTFFFSASEVEDYRRDKRRRVIDRDREARLQALRAEAGDSDEEVDPRAEWGGSDEEPDDAQRELMRRTASHILNTPNPAQLEMRILANHGADPRFAFLRGRWSRAWRLAKGKIRLTLEAEKKREEDEAKQKAVVSIGGLAGYGDSDDEDDEDNDAPAAETQKSSVPEVAQVAEEAKDAQSAADDDAVKAARRARAREWAEKRRVAKGNDEQKGEE
ncbi:hypothetical protein C8Q76DRAFT_739137 [Earliella scabrosa]|nr:hypothetical protein C8Q76DRAFT_739137 [Earliella scabrosa]